MISLFVVVLTYFNIQVKVKMFNHHIPPSFLEGLDTRTTTTGMNTYIRTMSVTYDTDAFCVIWNVSYKFRNKKRIVYVSWTFWIFPYISKFNRSMNVSKSNEIIVRRYTQWPLVRVCFIYGTINDRFPQLLWRETPFESVFY